MVCPSLPCCCLARACRSPPRRQGRRQQQGSAGAGCAAGTWQPGHPPCWQENPAWWPPPFNPCCSALHPRRLLPAQPRAAAPCWTSRHRLRRESAPPHQAGTCAKRATQSGCKCCRAAVLQAHRVPPLMALLPERAPRLEERPPLLQVLSSLGSSCQQRGDRILALSFLKSRSCWHQHARHARRG